MAEICFGREPIIGCFGTLTILPCLWQNVTGHEEIHVADRKAVTHALRKTNLSLKQSTPEILCVGQVTIVWQLSYGFLMIAKN